jgi:hypothetical protein
MTSKPILKIAIRGHVRDSFSTNKLYEFLKRLTQMYDTQFYIHTWDVKQVSMSWRPMKDDPTPVTEHRINTYFRDLAKNIKVIFIENDSEARLCGNIEGDIASTRTPSVTRAGSGACSTSPVAWSPSRVTGSTSPIHSFHGSA